MMDPALIEQMLRLGQTDPADAGLQRQQKMVDMLRQRSMQTPETQMAGRVALPNWGQSLTNAVGGIQANRMQPGIDAGMGQMNERQRTAKRGYLDALVGALRRPNPQAQQQQLPTPGAPKQIGTPDMENNPQAGF